jgi:hypothetical protein
MGVLEETMQWRARETRRDAEMAGETSVVVVGGGDGRCCREGGMGTKDWDGGEVWCGMYMNHEQ